MAEVSEEAKCSISLIYLPESSESDESCPQTRLHGGLSKLHSADDDAVVWLTGYGS